MENKESNLSKGKNKFEEYLEHQKIEIEKNLKPITFSDVENKELIMKYNGLMLIQKRKGMANLQNNNNNGNTGKYFESVYWKDVMGKNSTEAVDKFLKNMKIDPYASSVHVPPGHPIPNIQELEKMSVARSRK